MGQNGLSRVKALHDGNFQVQLHVVPILQVTIIFIVYMSLNTV